MSFWDDVKSAGEVGLDYATGGAYGVGKYAVENGGGAWDWLTGNRGTGNAAQDRDMVSPYLQQGNPYNTGNPYGGDYNALIKQLQQQASGQGPSMAGNAYNQASQDSMAQQMAMSQGSGSAGAARQAAMNQGNIQQGLARGYANARTGEMMGATNALGGVLNGASQNNFNFQNANQQAWLQMLKDRFGIDQTQLAQPSNMQQLSGLVQGVAQAGKMAGG